MTSREEQDGATESSALSGKLGRLVAELSRVRNPLSQLTNHLEQLSSILSYPNLALYGVPSSPNEPTELPLAELGSLDLNPEPLLRLPPIQPEFSATQDGPALLQIPVVFGGETIAIIACTAPKAAPPSPEDLEHLSSYGQLLAPTIDRAMLNHRLAENEALLQARSMGEMRAVKAVATANEMRREAEDKLLHAAFHDALTGLPNRSLFMDRLAHAIRRTERQAGVVFGILCVGVDRFKVVNDSLGHSAGDRMLVALAQRIQSAVRPSDTLARLGGDVFTILLEDVHTLRRANRVAERIQAELKKAFILDDQELFTSSCIGITMGSGDREAGELLRNAELAMHRAKGRGRGETEVFEHEMHSSAMALLELETDLRKGLERDEFRVHYQPVYRLNSSKLQGFEALVRWEHPRRGLLAPGAFLEVAEESGLMVPLGDWVLRETCRQLAEWLKLPEAPADLSVSVNLSDRQMHRSELASEVFSTIDSSGLERSRIALEITENLVMENADRAADILRELNEGGLHLHLDDFGTGYSSLSYLRRLPLSSLKIDRSFVSKIDNDREDMAVVQAIVMLARSLELSVIAEGIETPAQLQIIRDLGCEFGQGYLFAKPLPASQATDLLSGR